MSQLSFADVFNMARETRYTPVYYLNDSEKRLADLTRFRAMRDFMRGIQEAA